MNGMMEDGVRGDRLHDWYRRLANYVIQTNQIDVFDRMYIKGTLLEEYSCIDEIGGDTNVWLSVADEYSRMETLKKYSLEEVLGTHFGICTNGSDITHYYSVMREYKSIKRYNSRICEYQGKLVRCLGNYTGSSSVANMPTDQYNSLVSNVLVISSLSLEEAINIGLTNKVSSLE